MVNDNLPVVFVPVGTSRLELERCEHQSWEPVHYEDGSPSSRMCERCGLLTAGLLVLDPKSDELRKRMALALDIHSTIYVGRQDGVDIYECGCNTDGFLGSLVGVDARQRARRG